MQRVPSNNTPLRSAGAEANRAGVQTVVRAQQAEGTPLMQLARRIRDEQGVEGLREFLCAMTPYSAPNEIKRTGENFGLSYESIIRSKAESAVKTENTAASTEMKRPQQTMQPGQQQGMQMLQKVMLLQNLMNSGNAGNNGIDMNALMKLMGGMGQKS